MQTIHAKYVDLVANSNTEFTVYHLQAHLHLFYEKAPQLVLIYTQGLSLMISPSIYLSGNINIENVLRLCEITTNNTTHWIRTKEMAL